MLKNFCKTISLCIFTIGYNFSHFTRGVTIAERFTLLSVFPFRACRGRRVINRLFYFIGGVPSGHAGLSVCK